MLIVKFRYMLQKCMLSLEISIVVIDLLWEDYSLFNILQLALSGFQGSNYLTHIFSTNLWYFLIVLVCTGGRIVPRFKELTAYKLGKVRPLKHIWFMCMCWVWLPWGWSLLVWAAPDIMCDFHWWSTCMLMYRLVWWGRRASALPKTECFTLSSVQILELWQFSSVVVSIHKYFYNIIAISYQKFQWAVPVYNNADIMWKWNS